ncbi:helix-turn-helix transcriptional regulator [Acetoanaerobium noterae]|nr:helix-turn-helix transcriptional regulator [Acetoanaerobium noterae]
MTQEELAEKLGVSRQTVSKWELDVMYPEMDKVIEICKLFSCSMDELIR